MKLPNLSLFLVLLLLPFLVKAQHKGDYNWQLGWDSEGGLNKSIEVQFSDWNIDINYFDRPLVMGFYNSSISDRSGNLLLYTNGCEVYDHNHEVIEGTKYINPGPTSQEYCSSFGYPMLEAGLFLPFFNDSIVMLLHQRSEVISPPVQVLVDTLYNTLFARTNDDYDLVYKSKPIIGDTLTDGNLEATRGLSENSWWVIQSKRLSNIYFTLYLDSGRVETIFEQAIGDVCVDGSAAGQAVFSPNGQIYARYAPRDGLHIFDFSRETGILSNHRRIHVPDSTISGGLAFSSNSRFLYVSTLLDLFQFDLDKEDVESSVKHIGHYDGYIDPFATNFYHMQLGPDCRIYMNSTNGNRSWHIIQQPDLLGLDCRFEQHVLLFDQPTRSSLPNFPLFRVNEEEPCDFGIVSSQLVNEKENRFKVYPNPTIDYLTIELDDRWKNDKVSVYLYDLNGKMVFSDVDYEGEGLYSINMALYPSGMYVVEVKSSSNFHVAKFIKQ